MLHCSPRNSSVCSGPPQAEIEAKRRTRRETTPASLSRWTARECSRNCAMTVVARHGPSAPWAEQMVVLRREQFEVDVALQDRLRGVDVARRTGHLVYALERRTQVSKSVSSLRPPVNCTYGILPSPTACCRGTVSSCGWADAMAWTVAGQRSRVSRYPWQPWHPN